jgi:hypothetical protein
MEKKMKLFHLKSVMRQGFKLSLFIFNIFLEFLARPIKQGIQICKGTVKIALFVDNMILYLKDPKISTQKLLSTINSYRKLSGHKNQLTKLISFSIHQQ